MKLLSKIILIVQLAFSFNCVGQVLSQSEFDKLSKDEAIIYATDKYQIAIVQGDLTNSLCKELINNSLLFDDKEKELFNELDQILFSEYNLKEDKELVLEKYKDLISKFTGKKIPPVVYYRMNMIYQAMRDTIHQNQIFTILGKEYVDEFYDSYKAYYYYVLADNAVQKQRYGLTNKYYKQAVASGDKRLQGAMLARSYFLFAADSYYTDLDTCLVYTMKAREACTLYGMHNYTVAAMTQFAIIEGDKGNHQKALEQIYKAITYAELNDGKVYLIDLYSFGFSNHLILKQFDQAAIMAQKMETIVDEKSKPGDRVNVEVLKARLLIDQDEFRESLPYLYKALTLEEKITNRLKADIWLRIEDVYDQLGIHDSTFYAALKVLEFNTANDPYFTTGAERLLVDYYIENKQIEKAEKAALSNLDYGLKDSMDYEITNSYKALSKIYFIKQDYKKAFQNAQNYIDSKDFLDGKEIATKVAEARLESEFAIEKNTIALNNEKEILVIQAKQTKALAFGVIACLAFLFFGILYYLSRRNNKLIGVKNAELEELSASNEQLLFSLSHDIKEPMLGLQMLLDEIKLEDSFLENAKTSLNTQVKSVNSILRNLLDIKKNHGQEGAKVIGSQIYAIIQEILDSQGQKANSKQLSIDLNKERVSQLSFDLSPQKFYLLMLNTINNAIKYSPEEGRIEINAIKGELSIINAINSMEGATVKNALQSDGVGLALVDQLLAKTKVQMKKIIEEDRYVMNISSLT